MAEHDKPETLGLAVPEASVKDPVKDIDDEAEVVNYFVSEAKGIAVKIKVDPKVPGVIKKLERLEELSFLNVSPSQFEKAVASWGRGDFKGTIAERDLWISLVTDASTETVDLSKCVEKLVFREGSEWLQDPGHGTPYNNMEIHSPRIGSRRGQATGDRALARINMYCGLGRSINVPMWNSGIWVTLKAPQLQSELEFDRRLASDRVLLGRNTRGHMFSNDGAILNREFADFVLGHAIETSLSNRDVDALLKVIKVPDLHALAIGLGATIYVNGFPFRQPCITDIESCTHIEKATINIHKLLWVDNKKLDDTHRSIMSRRGSAVTEAEAAKYSETLVARAKAEFRINEFLTVKFKMPSLAEHFDVGTAWVHDLTAAADVAFGTSMTMDERNVYLAQQANLTRLREYAHWIESIVEIDNTGDMDEVIEHTPGGVFDRLLSNLSADADIVDSIIEAIEDYYRDAVVTAVGIPNYACPGCGKFHTSERGEITAIHPINPITVLFQMQRFRLNALMTRES